MSQNSLQAKLDQIAGFLSTLHQEVSSLERSYTQVLGTLETLEARLENTADRDDLSGLLRRKAFFRKWEGMLNHCAEIGETCSVLMIDIDHFKKINDVHGHTAGDEVIRRVATLLQSYSTPETLVGRYGGEEFILAVAGSLEDSARIAEEIRAAVATTPAQIPCTVSIGIAATQPRSDGALPALNLVHSADEALYRAKSLGRNQVQVN